MRAFEKGPHPDPDAPDLDDPIGESIETYREQVRTIQVCVDNLALHLRQAEDREA